jgi:hypothetical protein
LNERWTGVKKNGKSSSPDPADLPDHRRLTDHYEELRRQVSSPSKGSNSPKGLALFLHQGMPAWIWAWTRYTGAPAPRLPQPRADDAALLPETLHAQVAMVLTNMAVLGQREVRT